MPVQVDARLGLEALMKALPHWRAEAAWTERAKAAAARGAPQWRQLHNVAI